MKSAIHLSSFFIFCALIVLLSGCGNADTFLEEAGFSEEGDETSIGEAGPVEDIKSFPHFQYDQEHMQMVSRHTPMAISEAGYYYIIDDILYFYDVNSDVNTPLCSRVDCDHKDEDCDAYVYTTDATVTGGSMDTFVYACNCMDHMIAYYDGRLFMVERTQDNEFYLCRYDNNFNNKERLSLLASYSEGTQVVEADGAIISEGYLYYFAAVNLETGSSTRNYSTTYQCCRVKLEKDAVPEIVGEFDYALDHASYLGSPHGIGIYVYDGNVYYTAQGTIRWYTPDNQVEFRIARYNIASETFELLWSYTGEERLDVLGEGTGYVTSVYTKGEYTQMDTQGNLFFLTSMDENNNGYVEDSQYIVKMSLRDQTASVIYTTPYDTIYPTRCDGTYLYFFEADRTDEESISYLTVIDLEGELIERRELEYWDEYRGAHTYVASDSNIVIYGVDDRYILIGSYIDAYQGLSSGYFSPTIPKMLTMGVGVIIRDQLLNGEDTEILQIYKYVP